MNSWLIVAAVLGGIVLLAFLSKIATGVRHPVSKEIIAQTDLILRSANKWALTAKQDSNPIMALMHISYAKAYIGVLRRVLNDQQLEKAHSVDMRDLEQKMDAVEQEVLIKISQKAPSIMPEGEFAVRTGWLG